MNSTNHRKLLNSRKQRSRSQHTLFPLKSPAKINGGATRRRSEPAAAAAEAARAARAGSLLVLLLVRCCFCSSCFCCFCCLCCSQHHRKCSISKKKRSQNKAKTRPRRGLKAYQPTKALLDRRTRREKEKKPGTGQHLAAPCSSTLQRIN